MLYPSLNRAMMEYKYYSQQECWDTKQRWREETKMKRFVVVMLLGLLLLCLVGCGEEKEEYDKVGGYDEKDNTEIPGDGFAGLDDITGNRPSGGTQKPEQGTPTPEIPDRTFVVAIDAGHGGAWSGASYDGRTEKDENLKLAKLLREELETNYKNITVYMTREDDSTHSDSLADDLKLRIERAKEAGADIYVSVHFNASTEHTLSGAMVCISKQSNVTEQSEQLANCILAELEGLGLKNNGPYKRNSTDTYDANGDTVDYYAVNRHGANNDLPAIIMESCYMDNATDIPYMNSNEALTRMAKAEAKGIAEYLYRYFEE